MGQLGDVIDGDLGEPTLADQVVRDRRESPFGLGSLHLTQAAGCHEQHYVT